MGGGDRRGRQLGIIQAGVDECLDLQDEGVSPCLRPYGRLAPELLREGCSEEVEHCVGELESRHDLVAAELIGTARVVESEIAWRQRCLPAILRDKAVATELHTEFEVARIESPDGLSGAIDVD